MLQRKVMFCSSTSKNMLSSEKVKFSLLVLRLLEDTSNQVVLFCYGRKKKSLQLLFDLWEKWAVVMQNRCLRGAVVLYFEHSTRIRFSALLLKVKIFKLMPYGVLVIEAVCSQARSCTSSNNERKRLWHVPCRPSAIFRIPHISRVLFNYIWDKLTVIGKL